MRKRTYGKNKMDIFCQVCRCMVKAGEGELYRNGKWWTAYHDDCPGVPPHMRHAAGWVYLITGMGPDRIFIKIGMTTTSLALRVWNQIPYGRLDASQIWASPTSNRILSEATVHSVLSDSRVDKCYKLGREIFDIQISIALETVSNVTGSECVKYEWERADGGMSLKNDPIPGVAYVAFTSGSARNSTDDARAVIEARENTSK